MQKTQALSTFLTVDVVFPTAIIIASCALFSLMLILTDLNPSSEEKCLSNLVILSKSMKFREPQASDGKVLLGHLGCPLPARGSPQGYS